MAGQRDLSAAQDQAPASVPSDLGMVGKDGAGREKLGIESCGGDVDVASDCALESAAGRIEDDNESEGEMVDVVGLAPFPNSQGNNDENENDNDKSGCTTEKKTVGGEKSPVSEDTLTTDREGSVGTEICGESTKAQGAFGDTSGQLATSGLLALGQAASSPGDGDVPKARAPNAKENISGDGGVTRTSDADEESDLKDMEQTPRKKTRKGSGLPSEKDTPETLIESVSLTDKVQASSLRESARSQCKTKLPCDAKPQSLSNAKGSILGREEKAEAKPLSDGRDLPSEPEENEEEYDANLPVHPTLGLMMRVSRIRPHGEEVKFLAFLENLDGSKCRAEREGLIRHPGDAIVAIQGVSTKNKAYHEVVAMLRACKGQKSALIRFRDRKGVDAEFSVKLAVDAAKKSSVAMASPTGKLASPCASRHTPFVQSRRGPFSSVPSPAPPGSAANAHEQKQSTVALGTRVAKYYKGWDGSFGLRYGIICGLPSSPQNQRYRVRYDRKVRGNAEEDLTEAEVRGMIVAAQFPQSPAPAKAKASVKSTGPAELQATANACTIKCGYEHRNGPYRRCVIRLPAGAKAGDRFRVKYPVREKKGKEERDGDSEVFGITCPEGLEHMTNTVEGDGTAVVVMIPDSSAPYREYEIDVPKSVSRGEMIFIDVNDKGPDGVGEQKLGVTCPLDLPAVSTVDDNTQVTAQRRLKVLVPVSTQTSADPAWCSETLSRSPVAKGRAAVTSKKSKKTYKQLTEDVFWSTLWPALEKRGWRHTDHRVIVSGRSVKKEKSCFHTPASSNVDGIDSGHGVAKFICSDGLPVKFLEAREVIGYLQKGREGSVDWGERQRKDYSDVLVQFEIELDRVAHEADIVPINHRDQWKFDRREHQRKKTMVGPRHQVAVLPLPRSGEGNAIEDDSFKSDNSGEQLWDPIKAETSSPPVYDFLSSLPSNWKEAAMISINKHGYSVDAANAEISVFTPFDGSDWTQKEKASYHRAMMMYPKEFGTVARLLGKSMKCCLTYYYGTYKQTDDYCKAFKRVYEQMDECTPYCLVCGGAEELERCIGCNGAFHSNCLSPPKDLHLRCDACRNKVVGQVDMDILVQYTKQEGLVSASSAQKANGNSNRSILPTSSPSHSEKETVRNDKGATLTSKQRFAILAPPVYVGLRSHRSYYHSVEISLPYTNYDIPHSLVQELREKTLTVRVGDAVVVHCEGSDPPGGKNRGRKRKRQSNENQWFPFMVPWTLCEVVNIYRRHKKNEAEELQRKLTANGQSKSGRIVVNPQNSTGISVDLESVLFEIRWLYRPSEISSSFLKGLSMVRAERKGNSMIEEVFETNHMDNLSASTLLAPANIVQAPLDDATVPKMRLGSEPYPNILCCCRNIFDVKKSRLSPIQAPSKRAERGRKFSLAMRNQKELRDTIERITWIP